MNLTFSTLVSRFFIAHLRQEKQLSENTVAAYADCMRLLVDYACRRFGVETEHLALESFNAELVLDFLDHLETNRDNTAATRDLRLAAIKAFFHYLARSVPELMQLSETIQAIRPKSVERKIPPCLTREEVEAILGAVDAASELGARDKAILQLLYNTGARVQEIANLKIADICFDGPLQVELLGKGRKRRCVPLWPETVGLIRCYLAERESNEVKSEHLFVDRKGAALQRFGIGRRVALHAKNAAKSCPSLMGRTVSPHVFRHTAALHLLEAGNDITVVRDVLGHANLNTTSQYISVSLERKRKALEKVPTPGGSSEPEPVKWREPSVLDLLVRLSLKRSYVASPGSS